MKWMNQFTQSPDGLLWAVLPALPTAEAEALVWQRVAMVMAGASPGAQWQMDGLRKWLAQQKACPDLRFTPMSAAQLTTAGTGGLFGATTSARLFAAYIRKTIGASASAAYLRFTDDGTDAALSGLTAASRLVLPLGAVGSGQPGTLYEALFVSTAGLPLAAGLRATVNTTCDGLTVAVPLDAGDGFCITTN